MTDPALDAMAANAWLYFYPRLLMRATHHAEKEAAANSWTHAKAYPTNKSTRVIRPNLDTIYSYAWLDLSGGLVLMNMRAFASKQMPPVEPAAETE